MLLVKDENNGTYDLVNMSIEELHTLGELIDSAQLTHKRTFFNVKTGIIHYLSKLKQPKKEVK